MKKGFIYFIFFMLANLHAFAQDFSIESITSYPFISEITSSVNGQITAFSINEKGLRNIYVSKAPKFTLRKLTNYNEDNANEITGVTLSPGGKWIVYVRGADHRAFDVSISRNPSLSTETCKIQIFSISLYADQAGLFTDKTVFLEEGDFPIICPDSKQVDFLERKLGRKEDPTSLRGKIICLDPGHGGTASTDHYRIGAGGEREEWINLRVAQILKKKLEEKGAKVIMTRESDVFVPLDERGKIARDNNADVFISIHHNATADTSVNFPIIYFHGAASENLAGVALGKEVAFSLQKYLYKKEIPGSLNSDYTIFPSNGAAVLRNTYGIPAVLGEASFFTNPSEEKRLKQEDYNSQEATAYLKALELFFHNPIPVIKPMKIPQSISPFEVFEEAQRMNQTALDWKRNFMEGEKLMNSKDTNDLRKALNLFTLSAKSFPDSYVARSCHSNSADLLEKLNEPEKAKEERKRVGEFYVDLN
ncbi:MAG: N-acetylmuramoyl-L-alanine amidase [Ginsengibacter sp.]